MSGNESPHIPWAYSLEGAPSLPASVQSTGAGRGRRKRKLD